MAFGMAVITRPAGGLSDMFEDGRMGFLLKGISAEEVANALEFLIKKRTQIIDIGRYNAHYVPQNFLASKVAENLYTIYCNTL
jgi:glycosyltransferase involved in cell wall biosynthesis